MSYVLGSVPVAATSTVADIPWNGKQIRIPIKMVQPNKYLFTKVADKYNQMVNAAMVDGTVLTITTAYRDMIWQGRLRKDYDDKMALWDKNKAMPKPSAVARPGTSDHERAIAVDLNMKQKGFDAPEYKWLESNASRFGFINDMKTAVPPEPWHWVHKYNFTDADVVTGGRIIRFDNDGKVVSDNTALAETVSEMGSLDYLGLALVAGGGWWLARPYLPKWAGGTKR